MILLTQFKEEPFMDYNMFCYQCQETAGGSRLYTRRCLRQTAFRIESAGSLSVCHKRTIRSYNQTP